MYNNWKNEYYDYLGTEISSLTSALYISKIATLTTLTGTRDNPTKSSLIFSDLGAAGKRYVIVSGGSHDITVNAGGVKSFTGQGIEQTAFENMLINTDSGGYVAYFNDLTVNGISPIGSGSYYFRNCNINASLFANARAVMQCLVTVDQTYFATTVNRNSFLGLQNTAISVYRSDLSLYSSCNISINQSDINSYYGYYLGFDSCNFKIGNETEFTALTGSTEAEIRQNFVERCTAQGITIRTGSEFGDVDLAMFRWVFANNATSVGTVIEDSIIDNFQKRRFVVLGWKEKTYKPLPITLQNNTVNAISNFDLSSNIELGEGYFRLTGNVDIADNVQRYNHITSNVIYLGDGIRNITSMTIQETLQKEFGVYLTKQSVISPTQTTTIDEGKFYLLRSSDENEATATYNNTQYSSSLAKNTNIILGVSGQTDVTKSDNAMIFEILDISVQSNIEMRVVNEFPQEKITEGVLISDTWYFVEPDDLSSNEGYVLYNNTEYPPLSSFKVGSSGPTGFSINGNVHLRRCWKNNYDPTDSSDPDYIFWLNRQKPLWFLLNPTDTRCFMAANNYHSGQMLPIGSGANMSYYASGTVGFYEDMLGASGSRIPAYTIQGKFIQLRFTISTLNPL